jgi:hypothetical protein
MDEDLVYDLYLLPRQVAEYHGIYDAWLILNGKVVILTALQFSKRHSAMMRQVSNRQAGLSRWQAATEIESVTTMKGHTTCQHG